MIRRWNLTILIIICAFVLGVGAGYAYRDQFGAGVIVTNAPTDGELEAQLFESHVAELLKPTSGLDAATASSAIYTVTGRLVSKQHNQLEVEVPNSAMPDDDTLTFLITDQTTYAALKPADVSADPTALPTEENLNLSDLAVGDTISVYTLEDLLSTTEWHITKVQRLNN